MEYQTGSVATDDGAVLVYKTIGAGPVTVLFVPGWGSTKDFYDETLKEMSLNGLRLISIDPRGHGASTTGTGGFTSQRQARDILAVADAVGAERFVAAGQSMGAKYVQYLPMLAPDRIAGLVLIAGCPAGTIEIADETLDEIADYAHDRDAMRATHHDMITRPVRHEVSEKWIRQAAAIDRHVLRKTLEHCFHDDFEGQLRNARMPPTLVVGSLHDKFFPVEMMQSRVTALIPGAREIYLDCGHETPNEMPHQLAHAMECFLAGMPVA